MFMVYKVLNHTYIRLYFRSIVTWIILPPHLLACKSQQTQASGFYLLLYFSRMDMKPQAMKAWSVLTTEPER